MVYHPGTFYRPIALRITSQPTTTVLLSSSPLPPPEAAMEISPYNNINATKIYRNDLKNVFLFAGIMNTFYPNG